MKKYILIVLILVSFLIVYIYSNNSIKEYNKSFFYMDTIINVKIYANNKKAEEAFNIIDKTYSDFQKMTDYYDSNSEIYYINNNHDDIDEIQITENLYNILKLSLEWKEKSNGKFEINLGKVLSIWKHYRDNNLGLPNIDDLKNAYNSTNEIVLLDNDKIKNNNPSIDLGAITKGYATEIVGNKLEDFGIKNYIINAGGNVKVGDAYKKDRFSIGIKNPEILNDIYKIVYGNNISVVTSGSYERFYEYDGTKYSHIIDPETLYPVNNCLSVTIIADSSILADILSTTLFVLPIEEGLKIVNDMPNVEAIYYIDENNIVKSEGFYKYE